MLDTTFEERHARSSGLIPAGLDEMEPGPVLGVFLSGIDVDELTGHDRVIVLRAHQRMVSHYQAELYRDMASLVDVMAEDESNQGRYEWAAESAAVEIRAALTLTRRAADVELGLALELRERVPRVAEALLTGSIDVRRAMVIADGTLRLSVEAAAAVVDEIIDQAPGLTTGQLRAKLARLSIDVDPEEAQNRCDRAVEERRVVAESTLSGTANLLGLELAPDRVAAAKSRINRIARSLRGGDESRTMDQLRADVLLDLLAGQHPRHHRNSNTADGETTGGDTAAGGVVDRPVVDIVVGMGTLIGQDEHPGELAGYGPVIADIARQVVENQPDAEWRYSIVDDDTGNPIANGITTRRPTAAHRPSPVPDLCVSRLSHARRRL